MQGWGRPGGGQGLGPSRARLHRAPAPGRFSPAPVGFGVEVLKTPAFLLQDFILFRFVSSFLCWSWVNSFLFLELGFRGSGYPG